MGALIRRLFVVTAVAAFVGWLALQGPQPASADDDPSTVMLRVLGTGQCMDVSGGYVIQSPCNGGLSQQVEINQYADGYREIRFRHSNMCAQAVFAWFGNAVMQMSCTGSVYQKFSLPGLGATGEIRPTAYPAYCIGPDGTGSGAYLRVLACNGGNNQKWDEFDYALYNHRLIGGPWGRYYTVNPFFRPDWYEPEIRDAVASWNAWPGILSFTETTNLSLSAVDFYAFEFQCFCRGVTQFHYPNGNACFCVPTSSWDYAAVYLNHAFISADDILNNTPNKTQGTAAHEFGHALALDHTQVEWVLMYWSADNYPPIYTPQWQDAFNADIAY